MELVWKQTGGAWIAHRSEDTDLRGDEVTREVPVEMSMLGERLLSITGLKVCIPFFEQPFFCALVATRGELTPADQIVMKRGMASACHENVGRIWLRSPDKYTVVTGYGMTADDQMWRQHSWLLDAKGRIIETTVQRAVYFGLVMLDKKLSRLWAEMFTGQNRNAA